MGQRGRWRRAAEDLYAACLSRDDLQLALVAIHRLVVEFIQRIEDPRRWRSGWETNNLRRLGRPPDNLTTHQLRERLLAGPDQLSAATATYCLRAGLGAIPPHECGLPPVRRHLLPIHYLGLVDLDMPPPPINGDQQAT